MYNDPNDTEEDERWQEKYEEDWKDFKTGKYEEEDPYGDIGLEE